MLFAVIELHSRPSLWGHSSLLHPPSQKSSMCFFRNILKKQLHILSFKKHANQQHNTRFTDFIYTQGHCALKQCSEYAYFPLAGYARIRSSPVNHDSIGDKQHEHRPEPRSEFGFYFYWELGHTCRTTYWPGHTSGSSDMIYMYLQSTFFLLSSQKAKSFIEHIC